jgi:hypothetical protein
VRAGGRALFPGQCVKSYSDSLTRPAAAGLLGSYDVEGAFGVGFDDYDLRTQGAARKMVSTSEPPTA